VRDPSGDTVWQDAGAAARVAGPAVRTGHWGPRQTPGTGGAIESPVVRRPGVFVPALLGCALLLGTAVPAAAHPAPYSYLDIVFRDGRIDGTLVVHVIDVAHELSTAPPERLLDPGTIEPLLGRIAGILAPRLSLRAGGDFTPAWLSVEPMPDDLALRFRFTIPDAAPGALTIDTDLFPYDPQHQTFINIYEADQLHRQLIFDTGTEAYTYYLGTTQGALAVMRTFITSGIHHILIGPDHILFLIALLLTGGSWLTLVRIVTAFTVGHSVTLSLAALNIVTPPPTFIEPAIALSIVFVGADNLVRGDGRDLRAWVALVFGLVHGFGFANVLREFGLPDTALAWSLLSFNVGVEIGQLAIVLLVATALAAVRRYNIVLATRVAFAGSLIVIAAGTYWFVERVFFPAV
jgi:hydrogenase/urease accessory protein HupE